jgi:putative endonuclease
MKRFYVYIMASGRNGTLYIGITSNIQSRVAAHKNHTFKGFTDWYNVTQLVYLETHERFEQAVLREKQLKKWKRSWKKRIIEEMNPEWEDLAEKKEFSI